MMDPKVQVVPLVLISKEQQVTRLIS